MVLGSLVVAFGSLFAFVIAEARIPFPMVPLTLFGSRKFSGANLLTLLLYAAIGIFFFLFPLNLIQVQRYSPTEAGVAILPFILLMFLLSRWAGGLVSRDGARSPLMIGPLLAAAGFALFAVPSIGGSYWRSFFPSLIVLGFGMTVTVAPLTTTVMTSVQNERVGTASGINNAVARVAGVVAIAVLGIVMVKAFGFRFERSITDLSLSPNVLEDLRANEIKLAGLPVPAGLDPTATAKIREAVNESFVYGFRIVMWICAVLSVASAAVAALMIPQDRDRLNVATKS